MIFLRSGLANGGCRRYDPTPSFCHGAVAQLGERRVRNAEVEGSIPFCSTISIFRYVPDRLQARINAGFFVGGRSQVAHCTVH